VGIRCGSAVEGISFTIGDIDTDIDIGCSASNSSNARVGEGVKGEKGTEDKSHEVSYFEQERGEGKGRGCSDTCCLICALYILWTYPTFTSSLLIYLFFFSFFPDSIFLSSSPSSTLSLFTFFFSSLLDPFSLSDYIVTEGQRAGGRSTFRSLRAGPSLGYTVRQGTICRVWGWLLRK
jgi:hypothetical protein